MVSVTDIIMYAIASIAILFVLRQIWRVIYVFVIGPIVNKVDFKSYGEWAMITGSTDGIGKEYARQIAAKGCNVILVSRTLDKLKAVAEEIENEFKVKTKVIQADFTKDDDTVLYANIANEIKGMEIGVLVNNVGTSYVYPEYFLEIPDWLTTVTDLLKVNCTALVRVTALVLPAMVQRKKGIVINIGSIVSECHSPLLTVYSATKAFVCKFSTTLKEEYEKDGIIVQCVTPGYVVTNMSRYKASSFFVPTPKDFVRSALRLVNTTSKTYGFFNHSLSMVFIDFIDAISESYLVKTSRERMEISGNIIKRKLAKRR
ncbi:very-long-chain 3-oxoacyl-CoA reductase [Amyelois transitella]|uniref:very-long-chain 3-oxoacyl-CoA reductase n=1 Tax=Amyelois transitella TaxID=680683 RepID=UPI00298FFAD6|nr:very-long-chain 3-oxoacyl-CoA reductase [Amyelois transitella]